MSVRCTLAAALAAGLLLAGCTDEPEPEFTPTETPSPSASESETAEPEAQGPEEFIEEWFTAAARDAEDRRHRSSQRLQTASLVMT